MDRGMGTQSLGYFFGVSWKVESRKRKGGKLEAEGLDKRYAAV